MHHFRFRVLPALAIWGLMSGCNAYLHQPMQNQAARIGEPTPFNATLRSLPHPPRKIVAAVYKFRDQTGQYRLQEVGSGFSTMVTQGATNILLKAMEDSGWFIPIERENVNNLLNERKIIRSTRAQFEQSQGAQPVLPPLLFAGIILEGGIVSYDSNILTGGAGLRYFGAGASGQYRQDRVTVYLRATSTQNGEILKTVYTSKTVLSQALDGGIFRFVSFQRLLEAETGFTYNEPSEMAVMEAIEKALYLLIVEGIIDQLWGVGEGQQAARDTLISTYLEEKADMAETDIFGRRIYRDTRQSALALGGGGYYYNGDYGHARWRPAVSLGLEVPLSFAFSLAPRLSYGQLASTEPYTENILGVDLNLYWRLLPFNRFSPVLYGGAGTLLDQDGKTPGNPQRTYFKLQGGGGLEYFLGPRLSLSLLIDSSYLLDDQLDQAEGGRYNDMYFSGQLALKFFLNSAPSDGN
ncbi:MAG: CsgG/HfaB family protein [Lewinella sp.]|nr:CsgG/HfaB family protein [Lewinella sp.]